jgi:hypothetical protein
MYEHNEPAGGIAVAMWPALTVWQGINVIIFKIMPVV